MDRVVYLGHATTLLELDGSRVLTDPLLRDRLLHLRRHGPPPAAAHVDALDAVLLSHLHHDHVDLPSLRRVDRDVPLVVPAGARPALRTLGARDIREVRVGEQIRVGTLDITAVPARHSGRRAFGPQAEAVGYLLQSARHRVYFPGDTDLHEEMEGLGALDLAFMPVWGWGPSLGPGHLDPARAADATALLRPRLAVPIHWGTFYPRALHHVRPQPLREPPHAYARQAALVAPHTEVRILHPGEETGLGSCRESDVRACEPSDSRH